MNTLPPIPPILARKRTSVISIVSIIGAGILILILLGYFFVHVKVGWFGITKSFDNMFGDQHLKTAVALIELNKVRYEKYPDSLRDLKFAGQWDQLALQSVVYYPNETRTRYYIEVKRGWVGKPTFQMPNEFWKGTGFAPSADGGVNVG